MPTQHRAVVLPGIMMALALLLAGCVRLHTLFPAQPDQEEEHTMVFTLTSTAFEHETAIPARYTCTDADRSPALAWSGAPDGTASFALIMDDPDAPGNVWVHWVVFNLPANTTSLPEGIMSDADLPATALHGQNSWRRNDYGGPCPPSGTHRYYFTLYALDTRLALASGATKSTVLAAMDGHILADATLMGTYKK